MCMRRVESFSFLKKLFGFQPKSGSGYKIFRVEDKQLRSLVFSLSPAKPEGRWIQDLNAALHRDAGFHIYLKLADARSAYDHCVKAVNLRPGYLPPPVYVLRRVQYQDVVTYGRGDGMSLGKAKIVVAKKMFIEPGN